MLCGEVRLDAGSYFRLERFSSSVGFEHHFQEKAKRFCKLYVIIADCYFTKIDHRMLLRREAMETARGERMARLHGTRSLMKRTIWNGEDPHFWFTPSQLQEPTQLFRIKKCGIVLVLKGVVFLYNFNWCLNRLTCTPTKITWTSRMLFESDLHI